MASLPAERRRSFDRIAPALGVAAIHALIGYALIMGLRTVAPGPFADDPKPLTLVELTPPPPPERPPPPKPRERAPSGGAEAAPKTPEPPKRAPTPIPALPAPPPLIVAAPPVVTGGAPASGLGGVGTGEGAGGSGSGSGSGEGAGDGGDFTGAEQIKGKFRNSDFPASARKVGRLRIGVRYAVGPEGRVTNCEIIDPSGYPEVDAMTCRVIVERYRFRPARDDQGEAITEVMEEDYTWVMD